MTKFNKFILALSIVFSSLFSVFTTQAAQWHQLCPEQDSCIYPQVYIGSQGLLELLNPALVPFISSQNTWLNYSNIFTQESYNFHPQGVFVIHSPKTVPDILIPAQQLTDENFFLTDLKASDYDFIEAKNGDILDFSSGGARRYSSEGKYIDTTLLFDINTSNPANVDTTLYTFTGPPVRLGNTLLVGGMRIGIQSIYSSTDEGQTWQGVKAQIDDDTNFRIGDDRYNLLANPEGTGLWANVSEFGNKPSGLWESTDLGATWTSVDNGSFPENTVRVVLDPNSSQTAYALSNQGLYQSQDRGVSWNLTTLTQPVHGLTFISQDPPLKPMMVAGTDTGIMIGTDPLGDWQGMNQGLLSIPHSVTNVHGLLIAVSAAGYFTCADLDCFGQGQAVPEGLPTTASALRTDLFNALQAGTTFDHSQAVTVTEFYNPNIDQYFMTTDPEAMGASGAAGAGWSPTGQSFTAWNVQSSSVGAYVCQFYGSLNPGPNSHYWTISPSECNQLLDLQAQTPDNIPRWNFEKYPFMAIPTQVSDGVQSCPDSYSPIYYAYNNGPAQGKESGFRYVSDRSILEPLFDEGWIDAGIAFCGAGAS
ncbi:WD40/YVTN/BNR-like repeat-containing protein [Candidatus Nitrosacidococcus tergens]|uniref:BNR/Asp-box repeat domain protein n=1 Tax=Candidatus Nitrosacidococcus tergens TaxID=553981 RepID=A0A7G1Q7Q1_9GAMM|nr:glycosyl hydrolase [Candidatus Nitrosacidococcus tergens]CAB1274676.1 BNR/Asp-box repeat domain protein [Candidatus Nitrosacidococcus tergens]